MSCSSNVGSILADTLPVAVMEEPKSQQDQASSKKEKEPKLPSDCRIPVFKFLPTAELVRFVSKTRPLLGEYWSHELKFVVEQRLPFAIHLVPEPIPVSETPTVDGERHFKFVLADCLKNEISNIKRPELFQLSPLSELTEHVHLPAKFHGIASSLGALFGGELLASLTNLRSLKFSIGLFHEPPGCTELPLDFASLSVDIQRVLSQVESLELCGDPFYHLSINTLLLRGLGSLKKLEVSLDEFSAVMPVVVPFKRLFERHNLPHNGTEMLTRLESLCISGDDNCCGYSHLLINTLPMRPILHFLGTSAVQLRELSLPLYGEVCHYVSVFRAMPKLEKLALDLRFMESNGLIAEEQPITSVTDVSIFGAYNNHPEGQARALLAFLSKFPNVRTFGVQVDDVYRTLHLASEVLSLQLFPSLDRLKCFAPSSASLCAFKALLALIANSKLPLLLDLSSTEFQCLANEPDFLVTLYGIMKTNPVRFLLMNGPLHPQAVSLLEATVKEERKISTEATKVLSWMDKDLPEQRSMGRRMGMPELALADFTDVKICGVKNACGANREQTRFTVRICHQSTLVTSHIISNKLSIKAVTGF